MAKFECTFPSAYSFDDILQYFHAHLTKNHGEYTGGSDYASGHTRVAVRVYERYSVMGDNYLSLTVTLVNDSPPPSPPPGGETAWGSFSTGARTNFWRFFPTAQACLRE